MQVGATISTNLHETYASHGKDLVMLVASHVAYDIETKEFGKCHRWLTEKESTTSNCGKIAHVLSWYQKEYLFAQSSIWFYCGRNEGGDPQIYVVSRPVLPPRLLRALLNALDSFIWHRFGHCSLHRCAPVTRADARAPARSHTHAVGTRAHGIARTKMRRLSTTYFTTWPSHRRTMIRTA